VALAPARAPRAPGGHLGRPGARRPARRARRPAGRRPGARHDPDVAEIATPLRLRAPGGGELAFLSTITTFGTATDVTVAELAIESFFPADAATAAAMRAAG
jgi:hypothetical protein